MEQAEWKILPEAINLIGEGRVYIEDNIVHIRQDSDSVLPLSSRGGLKQ